MGWGGGQRGDACMHPYLYWRGGRVPRRGSRAHERFFFTRCDHSPRRGAPSPLCPVPVPPPPPPGSPPAPGPGHLCRPAAGGGCSAPGLPRGDTPAPSLPRPGDSELGSGPLPPVRPGTGVSPCGRTDGHMEGGHPPRPMTKNLRPPVGYST